VDALNFEEPFRSSRRMLVLGDSGRVAYTAVQAAHFVFQRLESGRTASEAINDLDVLLRIGRIEFLECLALYGVKADHDVALTDRIVLTSFERLANSAPKEWIGRGYRDASILAPTSPHSVLYRRAIAGSALR
jgi:hypothetical protein